MSWAMVVPLVVTKRYHDIINGADNSTSFSERTTPYEDGESVLDGRIRIRELHDPNLAVRFGCHNANVCKECTMVIDGVVGYACMVKLRPDVTQVDPLPARPLIRDVVTDTLSRKERI